MRKNNGFTNTELFLMIAVVVLFVTLLLYLFGLETKRIIIVNDNYNVEITPVEE